MCKLLQHGDWTNKDGGHKTKIESTENFWGCNGSSQTLHPRNFWVSGYGLLTTNKQNNKGKSCLLFGNIWDLIYCNTNEYLNGIQWYLHSSFTINLSWSSAAQIRKTAPGESSLVNWSDLRELNERRKPPGRQRAPVVSVIADFTLRQSNMAGKSLNLMEETEITLGKSSN
jgi:hypothetical protein